MWTRIRRLAWAALLLAGGAAAQTGDALVLAARDAFAAKDSARLVAMRDRAIVEGHALAPWVDYWHLNTRLAEARQDELDAFYARWPGSYVEDRLRNDWLLELGKRRDWANLRREFPRFRLDDDREARCYWLITEHLDGQDVRVAAADAWLAQRREDEGCRLMAATLAEAGALGRDVVWRAVRQAVQANRPSAARWAVGLLGDRPAERALAELLDNPARYLVRHDRGHLRGDRAELALLALLRLAGSDPEVAAGQLLRWEERLPPAHAAYAWAATGHRAALRLLPQAADYYARAWAQLPRGEDAVDWPDDTLEWGVRAALRGQGPDDARWALVRRMVQAMPPAQRAEPAWVYWHARARQALARRGAPGETMRAEAEAALVALASDARGLHFYGKLAAETIGRPVALPPPPAPLTAAERAAVGAVPGLRRALQLVALGLRSEGVREWNFSLRDLPTGLPADRALLAAAALACEHEVWDRCINTSDRTTAEIDLGQRYPMPLRDAVLAATREVGVDPATVYGLIRQESRFILDARSHVGASGLMQLMPATARWTARKIGLDYKPSMITDRDVNLRLGASYLKLVLDDFEGRIALGAAAYNAGPNRPRRWRQGPELEAAAWVENIPFTETRDYVKKVLSNAVVYGALLGETEPSLARRLGGPIGPRPAGAPGEAKDLP
jgi:soluble lytic murein transglycosylase